MTDEQEKQARGARRRWGDGLRGRHQGRSLQEKMDLLNRIQFGQRGFLRPQIIELFEQQPMSGVDIMNKLQEMSRGWYRPSPGSIYPLLDQLEKKGLIAKNNDGKFELTAAFAEAAGAGDLSRAVSAIESNVSYLEDLKRAGPARLSKFKDRLDAITKRIEDLNGPRPQEED